MNDSLHLHDTPDAYVADAGGSSRPPSEWLESKAGKLFDLHADRWQLTTKQSVNVAQVRAALSSQILQDGAVRTLAFFAKNGSAGHCIDLARGLRRLLTFAGTRICGDEIPVAEVANFRHVLFERDGHDEAVASRLRPFLKKWHALGHPGVSLDAAIEMSSWTLQNRERGIAVNRLDPNEGPLMPSEHLNFNVLALNAFEQGEVLLADYVCIRINEITGRRPEQLAQLKMKDMDDSRFEDPEPDNPKKRILLLRVPRIKGGRKWRHNFRAVSLSADIWNLLTTHRLEVTARFDALLADIGLELQSKDLAFIHGELPLFPGRFTGVSNIRKSINRVRALLTEGRHGDAVGQLRTDAASDFWHKQANALVNVTLQRVLQVVDATNRNGEPLKATPYRFRYTLEYEMERIGCSPPVIAWNMDHDSLESLVSYSRNGPDRAARLSKATARGMAKIARMFQGRVVDSEADAEGGDDPDNSRLFIHDGKEGATCAAKRGCGMTAIPRCCYAGCAQFRPWVDGPHEEFLEELLEERDRDLQILRPVEDRAIIEANDSVIIGVVQVLHLCETRRQELAQANSTKAIKRARRGNKE